MNRRELGRGLCAVGAGLILPAVPNLIIPNFGTAEAKPEIYAAPLFQDLWLGVEVRLTSAWDGKDVSLIDFKASGQDLWSLVAARDGWSIERDDPDHISTNPIGPTVEAGRSYYWIWHLKFTPEPDGRFEGWLNGKRRFNMTLQTVDPYLEIPTDGAFRLGHSHARLTNVRWSEGPNRYRDVDPQ